MEKDFFDRIEKKEAHIEALPYLTQARSWGATVVLDANTRVNRIHAEPSAHFHRHRTEEYILYTGAMDVYRGAWYEGDLLRTVAGLTPTAMLPGDRVIIAPHIVHIPINTSPTGSVFIEVSHGPYADDDIQRVYDKEGRDAALLKGWSALGYEPGISIVDLILQIRAAQK
ncbi:hypothetical protein EXS62_02925 [Candidatus Kaiserbacteria bacterium]|nr:hypothetical protein [Candidatus Kaiserbacteria bacterium]